MPTNEEIVYINCLHKGCECKRMFLLPESEELPEYVCIKHRRLHRSEPQFSDVVIKAGLIQKKGARSSNLVRRCAVLLSDRLVIYSDIGETFAIGCINLASCEVYQDEQMKRRFTVYSRNEDRSFLFETILDVDFSEWFYAIQNNIELLGDGGMDFRSWDEDDYITPGMGITRDTRFPEDLVSHHRLAVKTLRKKTMQRCMTKVEGDERDTLSLSIWTGTWNMGECDPPYNLEEWVPNSFDIIAMGVEECMKLPELEMRANGVIGSDYVYYTEKVGSVRKEVGFHGFIAMTVFIRVDLVQCGLIPTEGIELKHVALGKNLVVTRAGNKGGVRVRCPLHLESVGLDGNSQIDFICCHLASDLNGESKLDKRNKNAVELVQALVQDSPTKGYVFILGDLNYRITMDPLQCLQSIVLGIGQGQDEAYCTLLDNDQLIPCLATGATFPGFQELTLPSFPPTYKKKKGADVPIPDYADPASVENLYDYKGKNGKASIRVPSYTDRILFQNYDDERLVRLYVYDYATVETIHDSDHTPVFGAVCLRIGANAENGPTNQQLIPSLPASYILSSLPSVNLFRFFLTPFGTIQPMPESILPTLLSCFSFSYIHPNTVITRPGDSHSVSLLLVVKGRVKLLTNTYELKTVQEGEWFGGEGLVNEECGYTSVSETECICLSISESGIDNLIRQGLQPYALSIKRMVRGQSLHALTELLHGLIGDYDMDSLQLLRQQLKTVCKKKDKVLAREGEELNVAFYVIAGELTITVRDLEGEDVVVARLGPDTVVGTECLVAGVKCPYTITTTEDSLLTLLSGDDYQEYLKLDPSQAEFQKQYDQTMFHWVNTHSLPLSTTSPHILNILELLFSADEYDEDKIVWNPSRPGEGFRVLLEGKASVGGESRKEREKQMMAKEGEEVNEFDVDVTATLSTASHPVVTAGCILNSQTEKVRCLTTCCTVTVDKKQLKKMCMLIRWPYLGYGMKRLCEEEIEWENTMGLQVNIYEGEGLRTHGGVHVTLQGLTQFSQLVDGESFTTRDLRTAPYRWNENYRLGDGALGLTEIAGLRVCLEQANGVPLFEGVISLGTICAGLKEKPVLRHRITLKTSSSPQSCVIILFFKALSSDAMEIARDEYQFENITSTISTVTKFTSLQSIGGRANNEMNDEDRDLLQFAPNKPAKPTKPSTPTTSAMSAMPARPIKPTKSTPPPPPARPSKPLPQRPTHASEDAMPTIAAPLPSTPLPPIKPGKPTKPTKPTMPTRPPKPADSGANAYAW